MSWLIEREVEKFFAERRLLVFRQEPKGPASHIAGVLVIPARGERAPVGVPVRVRRLQVVERPGRRPFIVAHGIEPATIGLARVRVYNGIARGTVSAGDMQLPFEYRVPAPGLPDGEYVGSVELVAGSPVFFAKACVRCRSVATQVFRNQPVCRACDIELTTQLFASVAPAPDGPDPHGPVWFHSFEGEED